MLRTVLVICYSLSGICYTFSQSGYRIKVNINGFNENEMYLAYYYGDKQYIRDTVLRNDNGSFLFQGEEELPGGVYLVVLPPDNKYFEILIDKDEQQYTVNTNIEDFIYLTLFQGQSEDNRLLYKYLKYLADKRKTVSALNERMEQTTTDTIKKAFVQQQIDSVNTEVKGYQQLLSEGNPETLTAALVKAGMSMEYPHFGGDEQQVQRQTWEYTKEHYFDNIDLTDPRMLRTPILFNKVNRYVEELQIKHPDTIAQAIDRVLSAMEPAEETYKYYLIHFFNTYAQSKIVGMDAVYVHLANKYYATGKAPWTDEAQLQKIMNRATTLEPLLLGKIAPDLEFQTRDGTKISLHDIESAMTVLYFWDPECGNCKKASTELKKFYLEYKDKEVRIFTVCTRYVDETNMCWEHIDEKELGEWTHTVDPYNRSQFSDIYDVRSTPTIYVLDKDKKIISKRIGVSQLPQVIDHYLKE